VRDVQSSCRALANNDTRSGVDLSIEAFKKVLWVVLDGMGFEHARRCLEVGGFPAMARMEREGMLGPARPASPGCQTPSALMALFAGAEPAESGVWGYHMPDPRDLTRSISGFHAQAKPIRLIWEELEERGLGYSLMNVAFRGDAIWSGSARHLTFAYDGYRLWKKPIVYGISRGGKRQGRQRISYRGIALDLARCKTGLVITKGSRVLGRIAEGQASVIRLTAGTAVHAHVPDGSALVLSPLNQAAIRGSSPPALARDSFLDTNAFRLARSTNKDRTPDRAVTVAAEMLPAIESMKGKADLMVAASARTAASLVVGYFPVVDELNHVYADLLEREWPHGRASMLYREAVGLVDQLLDRLMAVADRDTLLVVSSDHGSAAHRSLLHLNELLADEGLVRRAGRGYDLSRSIAWYHDSDCGQVVAGPGADRRAIEIGLRRALDKALRVHGVDIGTAEPGPGDPYAAFLFPRGDGYFTGSPPRRSGAILDLERTGGHHLSPLCPTPWIAAMIGVWSPRSALQRGILPKLPDANSGVKAFLRAALGLD
jgi:hypothetical protein